MEQQQNNERSVKEHHESVNERKFIVAKDRGLPFNKPIKAISSDRVNKFFSKKMYLLCDGEQEGCPYTSFFIENKNIIPYTYYVLPIYEEACEAGYAEQCFQVGLMHRKEIGVDRTKPEVTRNFFRKGCKGGHEKACDLSNRYLEK